MRIINGFFKMLFTVVTVAVIAVAVSIILGIIFPTNFTAFFDYVRTVFLRR